MSQTTVYLKLAQNTEVHKKEVNLGDLAEIWCDDKAALAKVRAIKVMTVKSDKNYRYVFSVTDIVKKIQEMESTLEVNNIGETDFIVDYKQPKKPNYPWQWFKTIVVCFIAFSGAAFAIMTFNNDVSVTSVFGEIYKAVTGMESNGFTVIEIAYSIGLGLGIILFFDHFVNKKLTTDPTPLEVEMRLYEQDINTTLIDNSGRKESGVDVS